MTDRRPRWRRPATVATAAVLGLLAAAAAVRLDVDADWRIMVEWARTQTAAWHARDFTRPVLWGQPVPGDGGGHYARAEAIAGANAADNSALVELRNSEYGRAAPMPSERARALKARWAPAVAAMRQGARHAAARPRFAVERGFDVEFRSLLATRWLVNMAMLEVRDHAAAGRARDAVRTLLDAAAYAADMAESPAGIEQMIAMALLAIACQDGGDDAVLAQLDGAALTELATGLDRLDRRLPEHLDAAGEVLLLANWFVHSPGALPDTFPFGDSWRYGFSRRAMALEIWRGHCGRLRELEREAPAAWPQRQRWLRERQASEPAGVALTMHPFAVAESMTASYLRVRAQLRQLRIAVALHLGSSPPALVDPLTDAVFAVDDDGRGRLTVRGGGAERLERLERTVDLRGR